MSEEQNPTHRLVEERFEDAIAYYWAASKRNKRAYKASRNATIVLGALLTLVASISSIRVVESHPGLKLTFSIATPVLAAVSAIAGGLAQNFQWGAAWHDMVVTAQRLRSEQDDYLATPMAERDPRAQLARLNRLVLEESEGFFARILGAARTTRARPEAADEPT